MTIKVKGTKYVHNDETEYVSRRHRNDHEVEMRRKN